MMMSFNETSPPSLTSALKYPLVFVTFLFLSHGYSFDFTVWNTFWLKFNSLHLESQAWGKNAYFDVNRLKMYCVWKWCPTENHCFVSFPLRLLEIDMLENKITFLWHLSLLFYFLNFDVYYRFPNWTLQRTYLQRWFFIFWF